MIIVNAGTAVVGIIPAGAAVGDGQARNGDGFAVADVKHAARGVPIHSQAPSPRSRDGDAFVHQQFTAGQANSARHCEGDGFAVAGVNERLAQRTGAAVIGIRDCDGGPVREERHSEKQGYGNRSGADMRSNSCFHR